MRRERLRLFNSDDQHAEVITTILKDIPLHRGVAYSEGDCFFDSVAQGLIERGIHIPVRPREEIPAYKKLRILCQQYVDGDHRDHKWVESAVLKDSVDISDVKEYARLIEFTAPEMEKKYESKEVTRETPIWGRPDVEGRIFCAILGIKIHLIELTMHDNKLIPGHHLITATGSKAVSNENIYHDEKTIHIIGYNIHFTPMLRNKETPQELAAKPKKIKRKKSTTQENKTMSRSNNNNDRKIDIQEDKTMSRLTASQNSKIGNSRNLGIQNWRPKGGAQYNRLKNIENAITPLYLEFQNELLIASSNSPARFLHTLISGGFASSQDAKDGWDQEKEANIIRLAGKGRGWEDESQQESDITWLRNILLTSKFSEIGFAGSTLFMSIHDFSDSMSPILKDIVYPLLIIQAVLSAFINYNGIDHIKGSKNRIRPVLQIGNQVLDGKRLSASQEDDHPNIKFQIDPRFIPSNNNYNEELVKFYNHAFLLWLEEQSRFKKNRILNKLNSLTNNLSYPITNYFAASINWLAVSELTKLITDNLWIQMGIGMPFLFLLVWSGKAYYVEFTSDTIEACVHNAFTSENPLSQTSRLSSAQGREIKVQWFFNGACRGISIALGFSLVYDAVINYLSKGFITPSLIKSILCIIVGTMAAHNTWLSRMKGATIYLKPFMIKGPTGENITVPTKKLLEFNQTLSNVRLSNKEKAPLVAKAIFFGSLLGVPLWIWGGANTSILSLILGASGFLYETYNNYSAEFEHARHLEARKRIDESIESSKETKARGGIELPKENKEQNRDNNGNLTLTADTVGVARFNQFLNLLDQLGRLQSRAGTINGFLENLGVPDLGPWQMPVSLNAAGASSQVNEFNMYVASTIDEIVDVVNSVRESAGTPSNQISGCGISNFFARQLVCFLPFIFGKNIKGISEQPWCQWLTTCGAPIILSIDNSDEKERKQVISEPISSSTRGVINGSSFREPLLPQASQKPGSQSRFTDCLSYVFCCCRRKPNRERMAPLSFHGKAPREAASYSMV